MRYVILRDDDTNALTPIECLETLYRPFLDRGLPVNLATIPRVRTDTLNSEGDVEGFLFARNSNTPLNVPLAENRDLVRYLRGQPGFHIVQHGYEHLLFEFASDRAQEIGYRLDEGAQGLSHAGFAKPRTFIAPYDRFSSVSLRETARRFRVISTGWFELRCLPVSWWPRYALKKMQKRSHWQVGSTLLLSHPGCLLSYRRNYGDMLNSVKRCVESQSLTVLVTHWWEYFRENRCDQALLKNLHATAGWLADQPEIRVISFADLGQRGLPLN